MSFLHAGQGLAETGRTLLVGARSACLGAATVMIALLIPAGDSTAGAPEPGSPAARAIERHVAWLGGWAALDSLRDINLSGTIRVAGLEGPITLRARGDGCWRNDYDLKVFHGSETVTPEGAWSLTPAGQVEPAGAAKADDERRELARAFSEHLRGKGVDITHQGTTERDGRKWETVRFNYPNGDQYDLLLDPKDGSTEWERTLVDTKETWSHLTDWRLVQGVRVAFHQETVNENAAENQVIQWDTIAFNRGIPDQAFARPGATRSPVRIASGAAASEWAPVDLYKHGFVFLHGTVNGVETDLVLDSGAGMTVLDRAFAEKLGLKAEGEIAAQGSGGNSTAGMIRGVSIRAAGIEADSLPAVAIDLSGVARMLGRAMPVIFGKEVFNNLVVDLDYPHSRIRFCDPAGFHYDGSGHKVPLFAHEGGNRELEAQVEDLPPARFHLDTGNGGDLDIYKYYSDEHHLLDARTQVSERPSGGVGGKITASVTTLRSLTVGGYTLKDVPASFSRAENGALDTRRLAGNLGATILTRFRVLFDYAHDALWLEPQEGWDTTPFRKDRSGLAVQLGDGCLDVFFVSPGSPAQKAGWKGGEKIVEVNGRPIDRATYDGGMDDWHSAPAGTEVVLKLAGGEERRLKMQDYY